MILSPAPTPSFSKATPSMCGRCCSNVGLTGAVESSSEDVSEPLNAGSGCTSSSAPRTDPLDDTLVVREAKNPPNLRDAGCGGADALADREAYPAGGGRLERAARDHPVPLELPRLAPAERAAPARSRYRVHERDFATYLAGIPKQKQKEAGYIMTYLQF